jgi:hypothetical protein
MIYYGGAQLHPVNGGGKVFIEHVWHLNRRGVEARLVVDGTVDWWFHPIGDLTVTTERYLSSTDAECFVFTGPWAYGTLTGHARRDIYLIQGFRDPVNYPLDRYYDLDQRIMGDKNIEKIAVSLSIAEYHEKFNHLSMPIFPNGICLDQYWNEATFKEPMILLFKRKATGYAENFISIFERYGPTQHLNLRIIDDVLTPWQLISLFRQARHIIDFSRFEGFGLIPLEAMAAGCIVHCFDTGGNREYLTEDNSCRYDPLDPLVYWKIIRRINGLEQNPDQREFKRKGGQNTAPRFDWNMRIEPYIRFLRSNPS